MSDNPFDILSELNFENSEYENEELEQEEQASTIQDYSNIKLRIWLEKKHRAGKPVSLITGFDDKDIDLKELSKTIKSKLGVGGSVKNSEIIIQSQNRDEIINILKASGFKDVKKAGG
ncbi:MAG: translation initiation factor [Saprospiraceae bacterium]